MTKNRDALTELDFEDPMDWVYEVRRRISEKYNHDIDRIIAAAIEHQCQDELTGRRRYVRLPIARRTPTVV